MYNQTFLRSFQSDILLEVNNQIDRLTAEFKDVSNNLNQKSGLTVEQLILYLSKEQVGPKPNKNVSFNIIVSTIRTEHIQCNTYN